jgi:hypothetical protein
MYLCSASNGYMAKYLSGARRRERCGSRRHCRLGEITWRRVGEVGLVTNMRDVITDGGVEFREGRRPVVLSSLLDGLGGRGESGGGEGEGEEGGEEEG